MYNGGKFSKYLIFNDTPDKNGNFWNMEKLRDDAPEEAVEAFEKYKKDLESAKKKGWDL